MKVTTEIDHSDLDDEWPDDDSDDEPSTMVMVMVRTPDGMGYNAAVQVHEQATTPAALAEAAVSAMHGAARTHSVALGAAVDRWLVEPPDMEIVPGGEDA